MRTFEDKDFQGREGLSVNDACHITGLGRTSILDLVRGGALPARRFGRRVLILRADLVAWLTALPRFEPEDA